MNVLLRLTLCLGITTRGEESCIWDSTTDTCTSSSLEAPAGDSLLQTRRTSTLSKDAGPPTSYTGLQFGDLDEAQICKPKLPKGLKHESLDWHLSLEREQMERIKLAFGVLRGPDGGSASLDAAGFKSVTELCCAPQMEVFFTRYLNSLGYKICSKPHIQGLMHWFSCVPDMDFAYLKTVIENGNPCKYWSKFGESCPALSAECQGHQCGEKPAERETTPPPAPTTPVPTTPVPTTPCCKEKIPPVPPTPVPKSPYTQLAQFDCTLHPGPVQFLIDGGTEPHNALGWRSASLDVTTGKYTTIVSYPWSTTKPEFFALNACDLNPLDQIIYCVMGLKGKKKNRYIVRLDEQKVEFLVKNVACTIAGGFSATGTFYCSTATQMVMVPQITMLKGSENPNDDKLKDLKMESWSLPKKGVAVGNDFSVYQADFDGSGTTADYILSLTRLPNPELLVVKSDGTSFKKIWNIPAVVPVRKGVETGFGASFRYAAKAYFAYNGGDGVFELLPDQIDLKKLSPVSLTLVGKSDETYFNDGLNCPTAPDPFKPQGKCPKGLFEPLTGECPAGSEKA